MRRFWIFSAAAAVLGTVYVIAVQSNEIEYEEVHFSKLGNDINLRYVKSENRFSFYIDDINVTLGNGVIPQSVVDLDGKDIILSKTEFKNDFRIGLLDDGNYREIQAPQEMNADVILMHDFVAFGKLFVVLYKAAETIPSGRNQTKLVDGVDLYVVDIEGPTARMTRLVDKWAFAGIDNSFQDVTSENGHLVCAQSACMLLSENEGDIEVATVQPPAWDGYAVFDLYGKVSPPLALLRWNSDDRMTPPPTSAQQVYMICSVSQPSECNSIAGDPLPIGFDDGGEVRLVGSCGDVAEIIADDLRKLPNSGLQFVGANNHEGRIPWGQVYILEALLDLGENLGQSKPRFPALAKKARERVAMELGWWERLAGTEDPWFWSRRYSLDRADIVSIVHLGRMAVVVGRALRLGIVSRDDVGDLLSVLETELFELKSVVEEIDEDQLKIRKGVNFWLDGSNTPWNYQSAWIDGVASLAPFIDVPGTTADTVRKMVFSFTDQLQRNGLPDLWEYCTGPCQEGWSSEEGISVNTPDWEGNKSRTSTAHVSYRAMDIQAVLNAKAALGIDNELRWLPKYAEELVEEGWIYPMVSSSLAKFDRHPRLSKTQIAQYGRAVMPFEIRNEVWALGQLARGFPGCISSGGME